MVPANRGEVKEKRGWAGGRGKCRKEEREGGECGPRGTKESIAENRPQQHRIRNLMGC